MTISVVIPAHGRPTYLRACLESVLAQTCPADEIMISEDGAESATQGLVAELKTTGAPIRHIRSLVPLGQRDNRQRAFELSTGELVAMLDDDDQWEPTFLERASKALIGNPDCGFCSTDQCMIDSSGSVLVEESEAASARFGRALMTDCVYSDVLLRELRDKPFPLQATLFRRSALEAIGFFPENAGVVADFALFMELGAHRVPAYYVDERLGRYRIHPEQQTAYRAEMADAMLEFLLGWRSVNLLRHDEEEFMASLFRSTVVELAIAHAHERSRSRALATLRQYNSLGWAWPGLQRIAVLVALLLGVPRGRSAPVEQFTRPLE